MLTIHEAFLTSSSTSSTTSTAGEAARAARTLVLLNPFPFDQRIWADNVQAFLAAGHHVVTADYPGFVGEAPPEVGLSIDGIADRWVEELGKRRIDPVTVVLAGLSMGGYVALSIAARFPGTIGALVLADTRAAADSATARAGREAALATLSNPAEGVDAYLASSLPRLLRPQAPAQVRQRTHALAIRRAEALTAGIVALRERPDRTANLAGVRVPTLVIVGAEDGISPPAEMRAMADAIPGARFVEIAGAGHLSNLEQPAAFNRAVNEFVAGLP